MVVVKVSETYDLSTVPDKMGLIGIHTPDAVLVQRSFPGLLMNYKNCQFLSCDVKLACASMLPADPLQIGQEAGAIAPQDMFNPILYKTMTNVGMNEFELRLQSIGQTNSATGSYSAGATVSTFDGSNEARSVTTSDNWACYYGLLSDRTGWKTAMPQAGLSLKKIVPLVHQVFYSSGDNGPLFNESTYVPGSSANDIGSRVSTVSYPTMRGAPRRMPSFNSTCIAPYADSQTSLNGQFSSLAGFDKMPNALRPGQTAVLTDPTPSFNGQSTMPLIPSVYVACIVMPPAKLNRLYYRIQVTWRIAFTGIRSIVETMDFPRLAAYGNTVYTSNYVKAVKQMATETSTVDVNEGLDITKVM